MKKNKVKHVFLKILYLLKYYVKFRKFCPCIFSIQIFLRNCPYNFVLL